MFKYVRLLQYMDYSSYMVNNIVWTIILFCHE